MYDRRPLDRVSAFISDLVYCLLSTDPQRRPFAEELLRRIHDERQKVRGRSEPKNLTREEDDEDDEEEDDDKDDSDYETLVRNNASKSKFYSLFPIFVYIMIMVMFYFSSDSEIRSPE